MSIILLHRHTMLINVLNKISLFMSDTICLPVWCDLISKTPFCVCTHANILEQSSLQGRAVTLLFYGWKNCLWLMLP